MYSDIVGVSHFLLILVILHRGKGVNALEHTDRTIPVMCLLRKKQQALKCTLVNAPIHLACLSGL